MMKLWITADPYGELTDGERDAAIEAGAAQVFHTIPPSLANVIAPGTLGLVEIDDPEEPPPSDPDRLVAAELAARAAYDEVMAGGTRTLARIDAANQAASTARLEALET